MSRFLMILLLFGAALQAAWADDEFERLVAEKADKSAVALLSERASELVFNAMGFLGMPYRRGGQSEETGFDCSGFVRAMYEQTVGLLLPRRAEEQASATREIDRGELVPGDLVFFNTLRRSFSHVGIYVGDNKFIHSPRSGERVRMEDMRQAYWHTRFNGARRVEPAGAGSVHR